MAGHSRVVFSLPKETGTPVTTDTGPAGTRQTAATGKRGEENSSGSMEDRTAVSREGQGQPSSPTPSSSSSSSTFSDCEVTTPPFLARKEVEREEKGRAGVESKEVNREEITEREKRSQEGREKRWERERGEGTGRGSIISGT